MSKWQPIETAPKDAGSLLLWFGKWGSHRGHWKSDEFAQRPMPYWTLDSERIKGVREVRKNQPTHWMPLPPPPITEAKP